MADDAQEPTVEEINRLLDSFPPEEAGAIREFAQRPLWAQNIYLYKEVRDIRRSRSFPALLTHGAQAAGLVLYALFDKGMLPKN